MSIASVIRERGEYRFGRWGSFWHRFAISPWKWSVQLCKFEDHWALHLFCLWVTLWRTHNPPKDDILDSWGVTFVERSIYLQWGVRHKFIYMPWMLDHCRTEVMLEDETFVPYEAFVKGKLERTPEPENRFVRHYPYRYTTRCGDNQDVTATVKVERRSWCWRSAPFRWLRWPSKVGTCIEVEFSDEVGERRGSWKGGCIGCGYELRLGESPLECLRRMERERKFK